METQNITLLSFKIQDDLFAVDALQVDHILGLPPNITAVPNTPAYMKGIINLHGNIIPVADMRLVMGKEDQGNKADASIIVLNPSNLPDARIGILVDMVEEVIETKKEALKETITEGKKGLIEHFEGTLVFNEDFVHVINIAHLCEIIEK